MPIQIQNSSSGLEVTGQVTNGGGGPFNADLTMSWNPAQLTLKTVKEPPADFSSASAGVVHWFGNSIPATGKPFVVEFTCKASGTHYVTTAGVSLSDGSADVGATPLDCP